MQFHQCFGFFCAVKNSFFSYRKVGNTVFTYVYMFMYICGYPNVHTQAYQSLLASGSHQLLSSSREKSGKLRKRERMEECETIVDALAVSDKSKQVHSALPRLKYTSANFELIKNMQCIHTYIHTYVCRLCEC